MILVCCALTGAKFMNEQILYLLTDGKVQKVQNFDKHSSFL